MLIPSDWVFVKIVLQVLVLFVKACASALFAAGGVEGIHSYAQFPTAITNSITVPWCVDRAFSMGLIRNSNQVCD
jgi:hypothetical protein